MVSAILRARCVSVVNPNQIKGISDNPIQTCPLLGRGQGEGKKTGLVDALK